MKYTLVDKWLNIEVETVFEKTIQEFFDDFIPSKKMQHLLIQNKNILLDGNPVKRESDIVGVNLQINLYPEEYQYEKVDNKLDVVYEDEIILVVNKPKGLLVHSDGSNELTLTKMVESYYVDRNYISALPIHRLDKETSGLVVYSKSIVFQPLLDQLLSTKQIRRNYLAFVSGKMEENKAITIDSPIGKDRHNSNKRVVCKTGQPALTKVRSIGYSKAKKFSVLMCSLDTGRTHQIRLHTATIGHPIVGDQLYGKECNEFGITGQLLHAIELH